jgi:hypothetical protein
VFLEGGAAIDGFVVDAASVDNGIFAYSTTAAPAIKSTTVRNARKDGVVIFGTSASIGPNTHIDSNGYSGLVMRGVGRLDVVGPGNSFDGNLGGKFVASAFVQGAGIYVVSGQVFIDGGATASRNHIGVLFDRNAVGVAPEQTVSQLTAQSNRESGIVVGKGWNKFTLRKSTLTKNTSYGLVLEWGGTRANAFDIGSSIGGNVFGGVAKNGKAGVLLCGSPATGALRGEGDYWSICQPTQQMLNTCESVPTVYVDVAYVPHPAVGATAGLNPLAYASTCNVGP